MNCYFRNWCDQDRIIPPLKSFPWFQIWTIAICQDALSSSNVACGLWRCWLWLSCWCCSDIPYLGAWWSWSVVDDNLAAPLPWEPWRWGTDGDDVGRAELGGKKSRRYISRWEASNWSTDQVMGGSSGDLPIIIIDGRITNASLKSDRTDSSGNNSSSVLLRNMGVRWEIPLEERYSPLPPSEPARDIGGIESPFFALSPFPSSDRRRISGAPSAQMKRNQWLTSWEQLYLHHLHQSICWPYLPLNAWHAFSLAFSSPMSTHTTPFDVTWWRRKNRPPLSRIFSTTMAATLGLSRFLASKYWFWYSFTSLRKVRLPEWLFVAPPRPDKTVQYQKWENRGYVRTINWSLLARLPSAGWISVTNSKGGGGIAKCIWYGG